MGPTLGVCSFLAVLAVLSVRDMHSYCAVLILCNCSRLRQKVQTEHLKRSKPVQIQKILLLSNINSAVAYLYVLNSKSEKRCYSVQIICVVLQ